VFVGARAYCLGLHLLCVYDEECQRVVRGRCGCVSVLMGVCAYMTEQMYETSVCVCVCMMKNVKVLFVGAAPVYPGGSVCVRMTQRMYETSVCVWGGYD